MGNQVKPAIDRSAPWSPRFMRDIKSSDISRAVVYVIAPDSGEWCKVGYTTKLKHRLYALQDKFGERLHIHFWMEVEKVSASSLESAALAILRKKNTAIHGREAFGIEPAEAALAIMEARAELGLRVTATAGFPGAIDHQKNEVEEILSEPVLIGGSKGRLDREEWCPQSRSIIS